MMFMSSPSKLSLSRFEKINIFLFGVFYLAKPTNKQTICFDSEKIAHLCNAYLIFWSLISTLNKIIIHYLFSKLLIIIVSMANRSQQGDNSAIFLFSFNVSMKYHIRHSSCKSFDKKLHCYWISNNSICDVNTDTCHSDILFDKI